VNQILMTAEFLEENLKFGFPRIFWAAQDILTYDASAYSNGPYKEELRTHSPARAGEFLAGRAAARKALEKLNPALAQEPVFRSTTGAPIWPQGVVGSISHKANVAVAAVAKKVDHAALGIDLQEKISGERDQKLLHRICDDTEKALIKSLKVQEENLGAWVLSAKEAGYKALGFMDPAHSEPITSLKITAVLLGEFPKLSLILPRAGGNDIHLEISSLEMGSAFFSLALPI
jgi:4'-phosphopantetheinyl transferase EntD